MTDPHAWTALGPPVAGSARGPLSTVVVGALVAGGAMVVLTVAMMLFVYRIMIVPSSSMAPTLPAHSSIAINRLDHSPHDGDIIVFIARDNYGVGGALAKRVVAEQGETVACCTHGAVTRDGQPLVESYTMSGDDEMTFPAVTVPAKRLWVMGDHRANSADSRSHQSDAHHGTIAESDVTGTVAFHGSRSLVYAWVLGRAALIALPLGLVVGLVLALTRRLRQAGHIQPAPPTV